MRDTSYVQFHGVECILIEENENINLLLKDPNDIAKIRPYLEDHNFFLNYEGTIGFQSTAFIERMSFDTNHIIRLLPRYIVNRYHINSFNGFELTGEVIDDFFSPSRYFYDQKKNTTKSSVDLVYNKKIAESWEIKFENHSVCIILSFGDILQKGIASDLMLHAKLTVEFENTSDLAYLYRLYRMVIRFLQIIRYDTKCGKLQINLFYTKDGRKSYNGYLRDFSIDEEQFLPANYKLEYEGFKPYIQKFLQFAADNTDYTFHHYPSKGIRFRGRDYSAVDYMNIFAAFESECHLKKELYEKVDTTKIQSIKDCIISQLNAYPTEVLTTQELNFLNNAKDRILQLGTQFGQTKKIINAYEVLHNALDGSIKNIFYLPEFRLKGPLREKKLKEIANFLTEKRGAIAHGRFSSMFSDTDAQKIRFLEILTYAQMLKRVGLKDSDVERVIGAVFHCNYILFNEQFR